MSSDREVLVSLIAWAAHNNYATIVEGAITLVTSVFGNSVFSSGEAINDRLILFNMVRSVGELTYLDADKLVVALSLFDTILIDYYRAIEEKSSVKEWLHTRRNILKQIGVAILLKHLEVNCDIIDDNFDFLKQNGAWKLPKVNVASYIKEINETLNSFSLFENNDEIEEKFQEIAKYETRLRIAAIESLTNVTESDNKRKNRFSLDKIEDILMDNKLEKLSQELVLTIRNLEKKVLLKPVMSISFESQDSGISELHQEIWTDNTAAVSGPYAGRLSASVKRSSISSVRDISTPVTHLKKIAESFESKYESKDPLIGIKKALADERSNSDIQRNEKAQPPDDDIDESDDENLVLQPKKRTKLTPASSKTQNQSKNTPTKVQPENESDEGGDFRGPSSSGAGAVTILTNMAQNIPQPTNFPQSLAEPSGASSSAPADSDPVKKREARRWTFDQEEALMNAVRKHGYGNWASILDDPEFSGQFPEAPGKQNVSIKDKFRNMTKFNVEARELYELNQSSRPKRRAPALQLE